MEEPKVLISAEQIIAIVRNTLSTYDEQGLLNQQVLYGWVRECLDRLGLSGLAYYEEVLQVQNNVAWLPERVKEIEAIYSIEPEGEQGRIYFPDHAGYVSGHGILPDLVVDGSSITTISWFNADAPPVYKSYGQPRLLPLVFHKKLPYGMTIPDQCITRDGRRLTTHGGTHSALYLQYYGIPVTDNGVPEVPQSEAIYRAVRTFLIYRFFEKAWYNSEVPDILQKYQKAEQDFQVAMAEARYEAKLPSFKNMINQIRSSRRRLNTYRQLY